MAGDDKTNSNVGDQVPALATPHQESRSAVRRRDRGSNAAGIFY